MISPVILAETLAQQSFEESDFFRGRWSRRHGKMAKMSNSSFPVLYQLKVMLLGISPMMG
jgi:hypothetical protein